MNADDRGDGNSPGPQRSWARGNPGPDAPPRPPNPPHPPGSGAGLPVGGQMPAPVSSLRTLMMVVGGLQAVMGLALVTNSTDIATSHSGVVVFVGLLIMAMGTWGILTARKFPTRHPSVRNSAIAYGRVALAFTVVLLMFLPVLILTLVWLVLAILLVVRPNRPECRAWFGG
ncbi:hypothetical protein [Streptomyces sp. NPDC050422]|uniref:hypothetical protein n=1 Tax=Streptomyces sp. NPDC050422 TaxID=3365614 RepID=UPI0037A3A668